MSKSYEDLGFSALCAMGTPKGSEATWTLGAVGVGTAAMLGMAYMQHRSGARVERAVTQIVVDAEGNPVIDTATGQPMLETVMVKRKARTRKSLAVDPRGKVIEETAGVVVSELDEICPLTDPKTNKPCGQRMPKGYEEHLKSKHGVELIDDPSARRVPRKKELEKLLEGMTPREKELVQKAVFAEQTIRPTVFLKTPDAYMEEIARIMHEEEGLGTSVEREETEFPTRKEVEEKAFKRAIARMEDEASEIGPEAYRPATIAEKLFLGGRKVTPEERSRYRTASEQAQIGVYEKEVPLSEDELDAPIDITAPGFDDSMRKVLGYRLKFGGPVSQADLEDTEDQVAEELGQDAADLEVPLALAEEALEGGTTLRKLGVKTKRVRVPIYREKIKPPVKEKVLTLRTRILEPESRYGTPEYEAKKAKMRRAVELVDELRLEAEAKKRREAINTYWPNKNESPSELAPMWIVDMYRKYVDRQEDTAERIRRRNLGQNAGRYYMWEKDTGALLALFRGDEELQMTKQLGRPLTAEEKKGLISETTVDDDGDFVFGGILEGSFNKKIPVSFKSLTGEASGRLNQILLGFRRQQLRPEEIMILFDPKLDEKARKRAIRLLRQQPIPSEVRKQQRDIARNMIEKLWTNPNSYRIGSPEYDALRREPFARLMGARATRVGAEPPALGRKELKPYRGS